MQFYLHVVTHQERLVDHEGVDFEDISQAILNAKQSARDIMAEELLSGGTPALNWCIQIADTEGRILHTVRFSELLLLDRSVDLSLGFDHRCENSSTIERARQTFARARKSTREVDVSLLELRMHVRILSESVARLSNRRPATDHPK